MRAPLLLGIVNITADSFSDGGRYLDPGAAIAHARRLAAEGADIVDLGAAASNVAAQPVGAAAEIGRLKPVIEVLRQNGIPVSVDSFEPKVQRFAIAQGADFLNDVQGFPDPAFYPELARARCRLIVMHAMQDRGRAQQMSLDAATVWARTQAFFAERIKALSEAGIARERLIIDPGMGFFLSSRPEPSLRAIAGIGRLKQRFGLPVLISASRKSFLAAITGVRAPAERGPASLAAELYAAVQGADYIRTHDPVALRDALMVGAALEAERARLDAEDPA